MWLLVDIGNTRIKWCTAQPEQLGAVQSSVHQQQFSVTQLTDSWGQLPVPQRVLLSSVADPALALQITDWCQQHWTLTVEQVQTPAQGFGISVAYAEPQRLGSDRFVAMVAAYQLEKQPLLVVGCGTALTIDVLDQDGRHQGGYILPGLQLMRQSLVQHTAQLSELPMVQADTTDWQLSPGKDTPGCVNHGALLALSGAITRARQQAHALFGEVNCVLTGGDAATLLPTLGESCRYEPELVLRGLHFIAAQSETNV